MAIAITVICMLIIAFVHFREGLFTAVMALVNVILAGLVAFNFFEPLADLLDVVFQGTFLESYEDWFVLMTLFCVTLVILRMLTNNLANMQVHFSAVPQQLGGVLVGLLIGYLVSGFLICAAETLPWHENFMDFKPRVADEPPIRRFFPPDRVWLSLMRHAGAYGFARGADNEEADERYDRHPTFDRAGTFELRYLRYRRHSENRAPLMYSGELEAELHPLPRPAGP